MKLGAQLLLADIPKDYEDWRKTIIKVIELGNTPKHLAVVCDNESIVKALEDSIGCNLKLEAHEKYNVPTYIFGGKILLFISIPYVVPLSKIGIFTTEEQ